MLKLKLKLQFFRLPGTSHRFFLAIKGWLICMSLLFLNVSVQSQTVNPPEPESSSFTPVDSEFMMQVSRIRNEVIITITFNDSLVFDYAAIERKADFNAEFSQCKYISYDEVKTKGRHLVKKDTYAYAGANDVMYRIKLVTREGAQRIFPAINLPAVIK